MHLTKEGTILTVFVALMVGALMWQIPSGMGGITGDATFITPCTLSDEGFTVTYVGEDTVDDVTTITFWISNDNFDKMSTTVFTVPDNAQILSPAAGQEFTGTSGTTYVITRESSQKALFTADSCDCSSQVIPPPTTLSPSTVRSPSTARSTTTFSGPSNSILFFGSNDYLKFDGDDDDDDNNNECKGCKGKVSKLTLRYNGNEEAFVRILQKNGDAVFDGDLEPNEEFSISGTDGGSFGNEIIFFVDGLLEERIHTSCSKSIGPGLVAGDFEVVEGESKKNGLLCPFGEVGRDDDDDNDDDRDDDDDDGDDGDDDDDCDDDDDDDDCDNDECKACKGKVSELTMMYNGNNGAFVRVLQKNGDVVFEGELEPSEQFSFSGKDKGTFGNEIKIFVDGELAERIDTSCSKDIGPGTVAGDFVVIEGESKKNGLLCPVEEEECKECK